MLEAVLRRLRPVGSAYCALAITPARVLASSGLLCVALAATAQTRIGLPLSPGSPSEAAHLTRAGATTVREGVRAGPAGSSWTYSIHVPAGARCWLSYEADGSMALRLRARGGRSIKMATDPAGSVRMLRFTAPADLRPGEALHLECTARSAVVLRSMTLHVSLADTNRDGVPDAVASWLGLPPERRLAAPAPARTPVTAVVVSGAVDPSESPPADLAIWSGLGTPPVQRWRAVGYAFAMRHDRGIGGSAPSPSSQGGVTPGLPMGREAGAAAAGTPEAPRLDAVVVELPRAPAQPAPDMAAMRAAAGNALGVARSLQGSPLRIVTALSASDALRTASATPLFAVGTHPLTQVLAGPVTARPGPGVRVAGARGSFSYVEAMLRAAGFAAAVRGTRAPVWADLTPSPGPPAGAPAIDAAALMAALQLPEVQGAVLPLSSDPSSLAIYQAVGEALRAGRPEVTGGGPTVGVLLSDTALLTGDVPLRAADRLEALAAPLVAHGVPIRGVALERVTEPSYLDAVRTLVVSFDALWPSSAEQSAAIARWVSSGGSLIAVGGIAQPGDSPSAFWRLGGHASALDDLLVRAGVQHARRDVRPGTQPAPGSVGDVAVDASGAGGNGGFSTQSVDLTSLARSHRGAVVSIEPIEGDRVGCAVRAVELRIGGRLALAFRAGSELETRFLGYESGTQMASGARSARAPARWEYRFDNLPLDQAVALSLQIAGRHRVRLRPPDAPQPVLVATDPSLGRAVSRVRVPLAYGLSLWAPPAGATALSRIDGQSGVAAWRVQAGAGRVTVVGVDPASFTSTAPLGRWYRAIVASTVRDAGGAYGETRAVTLRRGSLIGVQTFGHDHAMEGRYVDLQDASLPIVGSPTVRAHTTRLFVQVAAGSPTPRLVAASGRVLGKSETRSATSFIIAGPSGSRSSVRISSGHRVPIGVRAATSLGRPVPSTIRRSAGSVEVRFQGAVEGVAVRVGWR
ncbi:MAG TPA: hypothetical protein VLH79_02100 [Chthonomonadales bacterium]|nr:hypothetical protein [Chthonomonadales bacterium]